MHDPETGRFASKGFTAWQVFMTEHECVREWLETRPLGTRTQYARKLMHFCEESGTSPEAFLGLDRHEARDLVWKYVKPFIGESTSKAKNNLAALKSFYRSKDGEILPFDSRRGGKHYFNSKKRKKAAREHIPNTPEMYAIIDAATNLRDNTMLLVLFQSGIRENALCHLNFKHVADQLYCEGGPKIPLRLRITEKIDTKLKGYMIDFYDAFLQGEAVQKLKAYCDKYHKDKDPEKPLFYTRLGNRMNAERPWDVLKSCVKRAGLDPSTIWVHTVRRAFKRVVRHANISEEFKEAIMGHVLEGSRENYFSRNDPQEIETEYMEIDFSRDIPETRLQKQTQQIQEQAQEIETLKTQVSRFEDLYRRVMQMETKPALTLDLLQLKEKYPEEYEKFQRHFSYRLAGSPERLEFPADFWSGQRKKRGQTQSSEKHDGQ